MAKPLSFKELAERARKLEEEEKVKRSELAKKDKWGAIVPPPLAPTPPGNVLGLNGDARLDMLNKKYWKTSLGAPPESDTEFQSIKLYVIDPLFTAVADQFEAMRNKGVATCFVDVDFFEQHIVTPLKSVRSKLNDRFSADAWQKVVRAAADVFEMIVMDGLSVKSATRLLPRINKGYIPDGSRIFIEWTAFTRHSEQWKQKNYAATAKRFIIDVFEVSETDIPPSKLLGTIAPPSPVARSPMKGATARGVTQVVWSEREVEFKAAVLEALIRSLQLSLVCNMAINHLENVTKAVTRKKGKIITPESPTSASKTAKRKREMSESFSIDDADDASSDSEMIHVGSVQVPSGAVSTSGADSRVAPPPSKLAKRTD